MLHFFLLFTLPGLVYNPLSSFHQKILWDWMVFLTSFILLISHSFGFKASVNSCICCLGCAAYIQVCRGLMISAVCLGFFGAILALIGMKCTKIGGPETTKAKITCLAGLHFILSGNCLELYYLYTTVLLNKAGRPRVRNQY